MYALEKGVTERTARRHLEEGWPAHNAYIAIYNRAAAIATVLRDHLPNKKSFWTAHRWTHGGGELMIVIDDQVYEEFLHERYDAMCAALSDAIGGVEIEIRLLSEVEAEFHPRSGCWIKWDSAAMTSIEMYLLERDDDGQSISASA